MEKKKNAQSSEDVPHLSHGVSPTLCCMQSLQQLLLLTLQCLLIRAGCSLRLLFKSLDDWSFLRISAFGGLVGEIKSFRSWWNIYRRVISQVFQCLLTFSEVAVSFASFSRTILLILAEWWYAVIPLVTSLLAATHPSLLPFSPALEMMMSSIFDNKVKKDNDTCAKLQKLQKTVSPTQKIHGICRLMFSQKALVTQLNSPRWSTIHAHNLYSFV